MTPKEKAKELVVKFIPCIDFNTGNTVNVAKQCALICVDEILDYIGDINKKYKTNVLNDNSWKQVKQEINNL